MTDIKKQADSDSPWSIFVPFNRVFGLNPDPRKLPTLFTGEGAPEYNQALWSTIGNTITLTGALAAIKVLANKYAEKQWDKKKADIHRNKVNALYSYNTPNVAPDVKAVEEVRNIGIKKEDEDEEDTIPKAASSLAATMIPPMVAIPTAFALQSLIDQDLVDTRRDKLDDEIAKQRNKLDKLYARLMQLQSKSPINKQADGNPAQPATWIPNFLKADPGGDKFATLYLLGLGLFGGAMSYAGYYYTKKQDANRQKNKILQKYLLPQNLTNVPANMDVMVSRSGKLPKTRAEQNYIEDLSEKAKAL